MLEPWIIKRNYWTRKLPALMLYQKTAIRKADCLQATAESERDNLLKLGYNRNIKVVRLGIDAEGVEMKKKSWEKKKQLLFLSRVHVKKGINFLIEAASVERPIAGLQDCGSGEGEPEYVATLKAQIQAEGLDDRICFDAWECMENGNGSMFQTSDVFVLPTHSENFGLAIAEALASGTPVVTTVGTPWRALNDSNAGAWIEIGTQPLVDTLRRFLSFSEDTLERKWGVTDGS